MCGHPVQLRATAQAKQVVQQYQAGDDMRIVAERWGISRKTVAEHLRRAGVTLRRRGLSPEQVQAAIELYAAGLVVGPDRRALRL